MRAGAGQVRVEEHGRELFAAHDVERLGSGPGGEDGVALQPELAGDRRADRLLVIDDEDARLSVAQRQGHVEGLQ